MARFVVIACVALSAVAPIGVAAGNWQLETGNWELRAAAPLQRYESVEPHMGTLVKITVYTSGEDDARRAFRAGFGRIGELDAILSDYKPDSELSRITGIAVGRPAPVSRDLYALLEVAQQLAEATAGAFDVTQGPVIRLWREARRSQQVPDADALREAASRTGHKKLHLDRARCTVRLDQQGMALDVGGIAKGYAASEALAAISSRGVRSAMVAISGDLAFSDAPPGTRGWRISVHDLAGEQAVPQVLELANAAVSTAGAAEQHLDAGGRRYSHIVDPATRMGLTEDLTVTVIARNGLVADGLDTSMSVLGVERGLALIDARADAVALIVRRTAAGDEVLPSSRFRSFIWELRAPGALKAPVSRPGIFQPFIALHSDRRESGSEGSKNAGSTPAGSKGPALRKR
jgi:thiamine biosynthesis lipoprotein